MTTWTQVQQLARQKFELRRDEPDELVIEFRPGAAASAEARRGASSELVHAQTVIEFGEPWLLLRVAVCNERMLDIPAALQRSAQQVLGALVLADHLLALRHGMPLQTLRPEDLERAVSFLAHTAAYLRAQLRAPHTRTESDPAEPPSTGEREPAVRVFSPWGE